MTAGTLIGSTIKTATLSPAMIARSVSPLFWIRILTVPSYELSKTDPLTTALELRLEGPCVEAKKPDGRLTKTFVSTKTCFPLSIR